jgi:hypothetical protein
MASTVRAGRRRGHRRLKAWAARSFWSGYPRSTPRPEHPQETDIPALRPPTGPDPVPVVTSAPEPLPPRALAAAVLLCFGVAAIPGEALARQTLTVPVRVHMASDLVMTKDGLVMAGWVNERHVRHTILPEVNRIWREAGVTFELEAVGPARMLNPPDRERLIGDIVNARRDDDGESDPERIRSLGRLVDLDTDPSRAIDVFLVPYLGEASQGNTRRRLRRVVVAQWTDKASKGRATPTKFQLTEGGPFREGSLGRTLAHELGHVLGLRHPDKASQTVSGLLMGGRSPGYDLMPSEIGTARRRAKALAGGRTDDPD